MLNQLGELLLDVGYPNVSSMDDDEIANLFDTENVLKFYRWFVAELLDSKSMVDSYKDNKIFDILCSFGYCSKKQKAALVEGVLDFEQQYEMILGMLTSLKELKKVENKDTESYTVVTIEQLNDLVKKKIDLFPSFTGKKSYTAGEREKQVTSLQEQIKELEERFGTNQPTVSHESEEEECTEENITACSDKDGRDKVDLAAAMDKFLLSTSKVSEIQHEVETMNESLNIKKLEDMFGPKLDESCYNVLALEEYFKSLNIVHDYNATEELIDTKEASECSLAVEKLLKVAESL